MKETKLQLNLTHIMVFLIISLFSKLIEEYDKLELEPQNIN